MGLLTDIINNKFEKSNLLNEHVLKDERVPLNTTYSAMFYFKQISRYYSAIMNARISDF